VEEFYPEEVGASSISKPAANLVKVPLADKLSYKAAQLNASAGLAASILPARASAQDRPG